MSPKLINVIAIVISNDEYVFNFILRTLYIMCDILVSNK